MQKCKNSKSKKEKRGRLPAEKLAEVACRRSSSDGQNFPHFLGVGGVVGEMLGGISLG